MKKTRIMFPILALFALVVTACPSPGGPEPAPGPTPTPTPEPASTKEITAYSFTNPAVTGTIDRETRTIILTVPPGTNLKTLVPSITHNGANIGPASGVAQNFYSAGALSPVVYTVTAEDGSTALWTVTVRLEALAPAADIGDYIANASDYAGTDADPIPLPLSIDLSTEWTNLLSTIKTADKYVALDLSASTMSGGEFDPGSANSGESYIVSLVLPDTATGIKASDYSTPTLRYFTSLKSLSAEQVTSVGNYAFLNRISLSTLSLPQTTSIGVGAFSDCTSLSTVELPQATSIGYAAFYGCSSLSTLSLPQATSIGDVAFYDCSSLASISLPQATDIGSQAFWNCPSLSTVSLPQATGIGEYAFALCSALTSLSLPQITSIGDVAFYGCSSLSTVSLPASLTGIGNNPFAGCSSLTTITVAAANSVYRAEGGKLLSKDGRTLIGWPTASATVTLDGITSVDDWAFYGCTGLSTLSLPEATSIGERAFGYTGAQELSITLGSTVPSLGKEMFSNVTSTKTVRVQVPSGASGYGSTPTDTTTTTWGNGFRGGGWDGSAMIDSSTVNSYIDLRITPY